MFYSFKLNWDELPKKLREEKITKFIEHENATINPIYRGDTNDKRTRLETEERIKKLFPIYI